MLPLPANRLGFREVVAVGRGSRTVSQIDVWGVRTFTKLMRPHVEEAGSTSQSPLGAV